MKKFIYLTDLTFTYKNSIIPLFEDISFQLDTGWTSIVGANGSGKTTLLKILCGLLKPDTGKITNPEQTYYSEQRTDFVTDGYSDFFNSTDKLAYKLKESLQIQDDWQDQWDVLSHGERKKCQIAVALNKEPSVLAIDEPSNHLDNNSKNILLNALKSYKGIGLLVSHDRGLMDNLCQHTIFINPPNIEIRKCNYSVAALEIEREIKSNNSEYLLAKNEVKKLKRKVNSQKEKAGKADYLRSKRNISPKDHDAKSKIDQARLSGKDGIEGRIHKRFQSKLGQARKKQNSFHFTKKQSFGITFNAAEVSRYFPIIISPNTINLGTKKILEVPELTIQFAEKIGIIGDNGAGKSTFLIHFVETSNLKDNEIIYIPQEITLEQSKTIIDRIHNYKSDEKGQLMTIISRLGSDPKHVLETTIPSPGEVRKLMLAEGIMLNPEIIIMDEPTNHMDLASIECIEQALKECACAQVLVSHDTEFLKNTVDYYWSFKQKSSSEYQVVANYKV